MARTILWPLVWILAVVSAPMVVFFVLRAGHVPDPLWQLPVEHFYIVSGAAFLSAVASLLVGVAGKHVRNIHVTFLSLAFTSLALIFLLHGLSTPGFLLPVTSVPGIAAQLSVLLTACWLWLSSCPADFLPVRLLARWHRVLVPLWASVLSLFVIATMLMPHLINVLPLDSSPLKWLVTVVVLTLNMITARHYWIAYRYSRFPLQLWLLCSTGWLAGAQVIMVTSEVWRASWWIYHYMLLAAVISVVYGLLRQYALGASLGAAVRGLMALDPAERIEAGISPSIRTLVIATEARDRYTAGHSYRVAIEALRLGQALGLPPEQLRALAQGGIVHDIGKLEVPDHILNKPGKLTAVERGIVERHPVIGYDICSRLGFMSEELAIIRHHHERWDGTGYPDGLQGEEIPLLARVLAVADVYDALTSNRSYRRPWTHEAAMDWIVAQAGSHFDPDCVVTWVRISGTTPAPHHYPAWMQPEPDVS